MRKKGFTLIELLVVIAIIAMLLAILMPALNKVKKIAQRVVCGTNLKGLGTAQAVYANDYEDMYVRQGGTANVNWTRIFLPGWQNPAFQFAGDVNLTIGASLYLLVREADVSPKSFVCGGGGQTAYDGKSLNASNPDLVELWDFGSDDGDPETGGGPRQHVSYAYHMPYSRNAATGAASASFAILADKNPWMDPDKLTVQAAGTSTGADWVGNVERLYNYFSDPAVNQEKWKKQVANSYPHGREGQNVTYGDGHSSYEKTTDVAIRHDNIYTRKGANVPEHAVRCGATGTASGALYQVPEGPALNCAVQPLDAQDSLLVNDDNFQ